MILLTFLTSGMYLSCADEEVSGGGCEPPLNDVEILSTDESANLTTLSNIKENQLGMSATFCESEPSRFIWLIDDVDYLVFNEVSYSLDYKSESSTWDVVDESGTSVGELTPYLSQTCNFVSKLTLSITFDNVLELSEASIRYRML